MISGFNTDIEHNGTVYHVQTEDKGLEKRVIMSLVYDKGTILASKRASYDDLAAENFDAKIITERVGRQHKLICAAVKAGRINELKKMSQKPSASPAAAEVTTVGVAPTVTVGTPAIVTPMPFSAEVESSRAGTTVPANPLNIGIVDTQRTVQVTPSPPNLEEPIIDAVSVVVEDPMIIPDHAVAVISELAGQDRPDNNRLSLELVGDSKFKGGDRRTLTIMLCRGTGRKIVPDAQIMVKVLGSSFRPVIFHAKSDANGLATVHIQLPHFHAGRAAIMVRAMVDGEEVELRRVVTPG